MTIPKGWGSRHWVRDEDETENLRPQIWIRKTLSKRTEGRPRETGMFVGTGSRVLGTGQKPVFWVTLPEVSDPTETEGVTVGLVYEGS